MLFRFQTGSIKRKLASGDLTINSEGFDSRLVRLKGWLGFQEFISVVGFDSRLVRLKVYIAIRSRIYRTKFRFQTGSIKRSKFGPQVPNSQLSFDSRLVRLKGIQ